jgi:GxxExxY protein
MEELNKLSEKILKCAFTVHNALGPGLLESAYEECLFYELKCAGLTVEKQKALPLIYKEIHLETGYRIDLIVNKQIDIVIS